MMTTTGSRVWIQRMASVWGKPPIRRFDLNHQMEAAPALIGRALVVRARDAAGAVAGEDSAGQTI